MPKRRTHAEELSLSMAPGSHFISPSAKSSVNFHQPLQALTWQIYRPNIEDICTKYYKPRIPCDHLLSVMIPHHYAWSTPACHQAPELHGWHTVSCLVTRCSQNNISGRVFKWAQGGGGFDPQVGHPHFLRWVTPIVTRWIRSWGMDTFHTPQQRTIRDVGVGQRIHSALCPMTMSVLIDSGGSWPIPPSPKSKRG